MALPKSPYDHIPESDRVRIQAMVPLCDKLFIQSIYPERGILLFLTESFIHAIVSDLRLLGINSYSPENADLVISLVRERTGPKPVDNGSEQAVSGTTSGLRQSDADLAVESSNLHESPSGRVGRRGSKKPATGKGGKGKKVGRTG